MMNVPYTIYELLFMKYLQNSVQSLSKQYRSFTQLHYEFYTFAKQLVTAYFHPLWICLLQPKSKQNINES